MREAKLATAGGAVRTDNACTDPGLFWGIKGGGGGSLGVVTKLTLRTRELPDYFGGVFGTIRANSDSAFRKLTAEIVRFYRDHLFNRHWGEQIYFGRDNRMRISMVSQGLNRQQAAAVWQPFFDWVAAASAEDLAAAKDTATNPAVLDAFALAIIASLGPPAFPGIPGHEPDLAAARRHSHEIDSAMDELLKVVSRSGSYVSESDFFE